MWPPRREEDIRVDTSNSTRVAPRLAGHRGMASHWPEAMAHTRHRGSRPYAHPLRAQPSGRRQRAVSPTGVGARKPFLPPTPGWLQLLLSRPRPRSATTGRTRAGRDQKSDRIESFCRVSRLGRRRGWRSAGDLRAPWRCCSRSPPSPPSPGRSSSRRSSKVIPVNPTTHPSRSGSAIWFVAMRPCTWRGCARPVDQMSAVPVNWLVLVCSDP
jgi:hypothetical protein